MAAGEYTIYDEASGNESGSFVVVGESTASTALVLTFYVGFNPSRFTFYNIGAAGATVPAIVYTWVKGMNGTYQLVFTSSTGVLTAAATSGFSIALETSGAHEGQYKILIPVAVQTASGFYTLIIER